jgi:hypothetical protein
MGTTVNNAPAYSPAPRRKSWFDRNWKWFVPALAVLMCGMVALFVLGVYEFASGMIRGSDAYKVAIERAEQSPAVAAKIGRPFKIGKLITGSIRLNNGSGDAELSIPILGDRGAGRILVAATENAGKWTFQTLEVHVDGDEKVIPLMGPNGGPPPDELI